MTPAILSLEKVRVDFGGLRALDIDQLSVPDGSGVSALFLGRNGAGKTTLLNAITGYAPVDRAGSIALHLDRTRVELSGMSRESIVHAGVGRTFQTPLMFGSLTVRGAMLVAAHFGTGMERLTSLRVWSNVLVEKKHVQRVDTLIEGLDLGAISQARLGTLSLPLLRRAELGRALAAQPRVLIMLDEPTAGADAAERSSLVRFLNGELPAMITRLSESGLYRFARVTTAVVTHDLDFVSALAATAAVQPMAYLLQGGRVLVAGRAADVLADQRVRESYLAN